MPEMAVDTFARLYDASPRATRKPSLGLFYDKLFAAGRMQYTSRRSMGDRSNDEKVMPMRAEERLPHFRDWRRRQAFSRR